MLAGWIASGRMRYSPELTHSRSIASASACEGKTPAPGARRALGLAHPAEIIRRAPSVPRWGVEHELQDVGDQLGEVLGLAGDHPAAEQRGDAADHRFVGRGRDRGGRRAGPARPRAGAARSSRPRPGSGRRCRGRRAGPRRGRSSPAAARRPAGPAGRRRRPDARRPLAAGSAAQASTTVPRIRSTA